VTQTLRYTRWIRVGTALLVVGIMSSFALSFAGWRMGTESKVMLIVLSPILMFSGIFLSWRGRQYAARASAGNILTDAKSHLLYLRAFRSDARMEPGSEEEALVDLLRPFGELVAIGRPGERLPTPGAARIYTSDEEWKDVVKRQMRATRLVVIRAAVGENVLWELAEATKIVDPQNLLILVLKMKAEDYESFRTKANPILGVSLPDRATLWRVGRGLGFRRVSGFIIFAADWNPTLLALKGPYFRSGSFKRLAKYALRPVFERSGVEWQPPPISVSQVGMLIVFVILGVAAVFVALVILLTVLQWLGFLTLTN
jgi:hypothetical protein